MKSLFAGLVAGMLVLTPFIAQASTIGASTSQTTQWASGTVNSSEVSAQYTNGSQYQTSSSKSSTSACTSGCAGQTTTYQQSNTFTNFSSSDVVKSTYKGTQGSYSITCDATAFSSAF